jgi:protein-L-isoaspartate(D-aspartate) O-methyltransferase
LLAKLKNERRLEDNYRHRGLRRKLVSEIQEKGITDENVLEAIGKVPRHLFMDSSFVQFAYRDKAFPIGKGQTISQPYTVAFQTQLLEVKKFDKVLEVGTGSGYQSAVLCEMGATVFTIERHRELYDKVRALLPSLGYEPMFFHGDGYAGLPTYGPFDKIIVTAGAPYVPEALLEQLKVGGRLVIPVGSQHRQEMKLVIRESETEYRTEDRGGFIFVPLVGGKSE